MYIFVLQIQKVLEEMDKKNKVLSSWTKERVNQAAAVKQAWNNFQALLDNQQFHINRQVDHFSDELIRFWLSKLRKVFLYTEPIPSLTSPEIL